MATTLGGGRRIVLGLSGQQTVQLIGWATMLVRPGDIVRIVHGYRPVPYASVDWQLPVDNDNLVRGATERHVRAVASRLRRYRPDVVVMDELTGDPAGTALADAARDADLVLVGVPHGDRSRSMLAALLAEVGCPVVVVGAAAPAMTGPVIAVLQGGDADDAVLQAGFAEAHRRRRGLLVLKTWQPPLNGSPAPAESAERQILDGQLASRRSRYPDVRAVGELRIGDLPGVLAEQPANADLLVLGVPSHAGDQHALLSSVPARGGPTMLIPAGSPGYESLSGLAASGAGLT